MRPSTSISLRFLALTAPVRGALWMMLAASAFSVMIVLVRWLGETYDAFEIVFFRNFGSLVAMMPWLLGAGVGVMRTERLGGHLWRGCLSLGGMTMWFVSIQLLPLAEATALSFTAPMFTSILAVLFLGEVMRVRRWSAIAVGLIGVLIILRPTPDAVDPAALFAIGTALVWATASITVKMLSRTERPEVIVTYQVLIATPISLVPALFVWQTPGLADLGLFALLGGSATVGQLCMTRAFAVADAGFVAPFDYLRLPMVALAALVLYGEVPDGWTLLGAAVITGSAVYIAHREARTARHAAKIAPVQV